MIERVVLVNHRYAPFRGGSENSAREIARGAIARGWEASVVTTDARDLEYFWDAQKRRVDEPRVETLDGARIERVPVRHLPASSILFRGLHRLMGEASRLPLPARPFELIARRQPYLPELRAAIADQLPACVLHAANLALEGMAVTAADLAQRAGTAFVFSPYAHLGSDDDRIARRFVTMPHQRRLVRRADALVAMTRMEAAFLASQGVDPSRVVVAGSGVHPEEVTGGRRDAFRRRLRVNGALVVALGALAEDKGTTHLVEAVTDLRAAGMDVQLALAGPPLSRFQRWYTARDRQGRDGVHLLGMISDEEKRDLLAGADLLALPSRTESFGIVLLEAWMNGLPVVGASAGAIPELVRPGENGLLVPFGDRRALAAAIRRLTIDRELAARMGAAGREMTLAQFTWPVVLERIWRAYDIALKRRHEREAYGKQSARPRG